MRAARDNRQCTLGFARHRAGALAAGLRCFGQGGASADAQHEEDETSHGYGVALVLAVVLPRYDLPERRTGSGPVREYHGTTMVHSTVP